MFQGTLNTYLKAHHLYTCAGGDCNNLVLNSTLALTGRVVPQGESWDMTYDDVATHVEQGSAFFLAHVRNASHFVLLTSAQRGNESFAVLDPFYNVTSYSFSGISDVITYRILDTPLTEYHVEMPLFKQCDPRWGDDVIVSETVCAVGCLMSSISMAIRGRGVRIAQQLSDPGVLNTWLRTHNGYTSGNDLEESALNDVNGSLVRWSASGMHTHNDLSPGTLRSYILQGRTVIANVMQGKHFVLATGWSYTDDVILVNDPGFNVTQYSRVNDVVGWRVFDINEIWT